MPRDQQHFAGSEADATAGRAALAAAGYEVAPPLDQPLDYLNRGDIGREDVPVVRMFYVAWENDPALPHHLPDPEPPSGLMRVPAPIGAAASGSF